MKTRVVRVLTGVLLCALTACATEPAHIALKSELSQRVTSANGVILTSQKELVAIVEESKVSQSTGGGLLPMIIDASRNHSRAAAAEGAVRPIRDALAEYDVGAELQHALGTRLKTIPWLHMKKVDVVHDSKPKMIPSLLAASPEDVLLLVTPSYVLSADFTVLHFETDVRVVPRAAHLMLPDAGDDAEKRIAPLYKTHVSHRTTATVQGDSILAASNAWTNDGGKQIKDAFRESIRTTADQIIEALSHPERTPATP
ncbi:MAG: hypothetical protein E8D40_03505 [Nitrospira sp.]|nr:MAG: hypothetical protein E8D40_03505 [Nitrospira sp.]